MRVGADRVDVQYRWPTTLRVPTRPPKLVYLDLNHWIGFAKALAGHADGHAYREWFDRCMALVQNGQVVFPISDAVYTEVSKIGQYRQRRDIREAIEALSHFVVVTSRPVIATHEVETLLDEAVGPNPVPINTMDYLDWGVARAFGMMGGFRVRDGDHADITNEVRATWPGGSDAFDAVVAAAELDLNRSVLDGPSADEEPQLRALGWDPTGTIAVTENRARQELEQVERFNADPRWRAGRIRDVVAAREVLIEINETLHRGLRERGAALDDVFGSPERTRGLLDSLPSFDVAVTLKMAYHRDPNHRWTTNDIHDIDALGSTMPYCDVVITDRAVAAHANATGLTDRLGTVVLARLDDLPAHI
ncbi:MAG: hypothetical protein WEC34_06350 [Acidimicrobiia bacterium]